MTAEELVVAIRVTAENAQETIDAIRASCEGLGETVEKTKKEGDGAFSPLKHSAEEAAAAQAVLSAAAASAFAAIRKAVRDGTDAYNEFVAAAKGLESIASGKGIAQEQLTGALEEVTDEFLTADAAATAFKNLLTRGFSLEKAVQVIDRLKNSAAFGRAANLSLSEAVVTATEGIRQENSVLVDNAGVTKNVAKMWEDYAKARGMTTASLTQAQKVEAEYIGIMQETELQAGDLEKAADTLAGAQARSAAQSQKLAASYGGALEPAMKLAADVSGEVLKGMNDLVTAAPGLTSGLTTAAAAMALYVTVTKAAEAAQRLFSAASITMNPVMMGIAAAVGVAAAGYTAYKKAQQEAAEAQKKAQEAAQAESRAQQQNALDLQEREKSLNRLGRTYKELTDTQNRTESQNARLERIIGELSSQYGISEEALRGLDGQYGAGNAAIEERIRLYGEEKKKLLEKQLEEKKAALEAAKTQKDKNEELQRQVEAFGKKPDFSKAGIKGDWDMEMTEYVSAVNNTEAMPEAYNLAQKLIDALYKAGSTEEAEAAWNAFFEDLNKNCEESTEKVSALEDEMENLQAAIDGKEDYKAPAAGSEAAGLVPGAENGAKTAQETADAYQKTLDAMVGIQEAKANIAALESEEATLEEKKAAAIALQREGYGYLLGDAEAIAAAKALIFQQDEAQLEAYNQQREALENQLESLKAAHEAGKIGDSDYEAEASRLNAALAKTREGTLEAAEGMNRLKDSADETGSAFSGVQKDATQLNQKLRRALNFRQDIRSMKDMASQVEKTGGSWDDLSEEVKEFSRRMGIAEGDLAGTTAGLADMEKQTDLSAAGMVSELQGILGELETMRAEMLAIPQAELTADASQAMDEINALIAMINLVLSLAGQAGVDMTGQGQKSRRGGGGGKSRRNDEEEAAREAERAAREAERAQEEAFRKEIERIEHRRHLGEITAQEEIEALERVKREYARTAEQIMDIDKRIYDARKALKEKEQDKITQLHESVVDALEARYEAQREAEQKRISESIAAWNKWAEDTCAAIQKQIDALDEQEKAEDRAATEREHLRRIAGLKEALVYEKDAYNRGQLEKQIEKAQEDWEKVQKGWAKDDKRKELEEQLKGVEEQAQKEIDALEKESERVDSVYDDMMKEQSLAAEAQKVLMQSTQEELLDLLGSYAPDYEAAGKSLGEKLYEGFQEAFGNITAWFDQIDARFEEMAEKAQEAAFGKTSSLQAAGEHTADVSKPEIHQTVNFNQPVESPAEFTRRMQQVGEELAGMM